jgi:hypothetical protein
MGKWKTFLEACEDHEVFFFFFSNKIVVCKAVDKARKNQNVTTFSISQIETT